ncbi:MAG: hypothetical protein AB1568_16395 [Thermodesulfobacteriota bacterium]
MELVYELLSRLSRPIVVFCVFLAVLFLVVRPLTAWLAGYVARRSRQQDGETEEQQAAPLDAEMESLLAEAREAEMTLTNQERIRRLAASDPERAKELIRTWLHES